MCNFIQKHHLFLVFLVWKVDLWVVLIVQGLDCNNWKALHRDKGVAPVEVIQESSQAFTLSFFHFLAQWENYKSTQRLLITVISLMPPQPCCTFWAFPLKIQIGDVVLSLKPPKTRIKPQSDYEVMAINKGKAASESSVSN